MSNAKLDNAPVILPVPDVAATAAWYRDVLDFRVVEHLEAAEPFAAAYRDAVELVFVQIAAGGAPFEPNRVRYRAGYDVYLDPDTVEGVDGLFAEVTARGATVVRPPARVGYGSYEFVIEDPDGRWVCVGRVADRAFFKGLFD
jgi:catechol 2,3-dioxygenase-like lactoylglutathione lyase family enzyme